MPNTNWSTSNWAAIESSSHALLGIVRNLNELIGNGGGNTSADDIRWAVEEATSALTHLQAIAANRLH